MISVERGFSWSKNPLFDAWGEPEIAKNCMAKRKEPLMSQSEEIRHNCRALLRLFV